MPKSRVKNYSPYSLAAAALLGKQIKRGRIQKSWSEKELAARANVSRETIQRAEKGAPSCAIGTMFELAYLVETPLFESDLTAIQAQTVAIDQHLTLLPSRIRTSATKVQDDDF